MAEEITKYFSVEEPPRSILCWDLEDKNDLIMGKRIFGQREQYIHAKIKQRKGGALASGMQSEGKQKRWGWWKDGGQTM